ncbi:MAG: hypothetical protein ACYC61_22580, partial [Isosphaeraceae bacterium]
MVAAAAGIGGTEAIGPGEPLATRSAIPTATSPTAAAIADVGREAAIPWRTAIIDRAETAEARPTAASSVARSSAGGTSAAARASSPAATSPANDGASPR